MANPTTARPGTEGYVKDHAVLDRAIRQGKIEAVFEQAR